MHLSETVGAQVPSDEGRHESQGGGRSGSGLRRGLDGRGGGEKDHQGGKIVDCGKDPRLCMLGGVQLCVYAVT